jgi:hypothetical protein
MKAVWVARSATRITQKAHALLCVTAATMARHAAPAAATALLATQQTDHALILCRQYGCMARDRFIWQPEIVYLEV